MKTLVASASLAVVVVVFCSQTATPLAAPTTGGGGSSQDSSSYWLKRKQEFYTNTTFELSDDSVRLLGGKFTEIKTGHLPFWFDYQLFKKAFNKHYNNPDEELAREHIYVKTCVRALKARVLYRILAGTQDTNITCDADLFYEEKVGQVVASTCQQGKEVNFSVTFDIEQGESGESPVAKAVRLVRQELDRVESRNQLVNYLQAFDEVGGGAIAAKLPY